MGLVRSESSTSEFGFTDNSNYTITPRDVGGNFQTLSGVKVSPFATLELSDAGAIDLGKTGLEIASGIFDRAINVVESNSENALEISRASAARLEDIYDATVSRQQKTETDKLQDNLRFGGVVLAVLAAFWVWKK